METGALLVLLAGHGVLYPLICLPIHKGLIWLLVATIAEVLPAVSGWFYFPVHSTHHDIISQVFIALNLNGKFRFLFTLLKRNTDGWTRFCSKY